MSRLALLHYSKPALDLAGAGSISGSGAVEAVLTCTPPSYTVNGNSVSPSFTFQWTADSVNIPAATSSTYTPAASDDAKTISCSTVATFQGRTDSQTFGSVTVFVNSGPGPSGWVGFDIADDPGIPSPTGSGVNRYVSTTGASSGTGTNSGARISIEHALSIAPAR